VAVKQLLEGSGVCVVVREREVHVGVLLKLLLDDIRRAKVKELLFDFVSILFVLRNVAREISHHVKRAFIEKTNILEVKKKN
jgi:hypothetical protein